MNENNIQNFNNANLTSVIKTCYAKPFYEVLIIALKQIMPIRLIVENAIFELYTHEHNNFRITPDTFIFPNNSQIKIVRYDDTLKGYKVHEILLDNLSELLTNITYPELIRNVSSMLIDYEEEQKWQEEISF